MPHPFLLKNSRTPSEALSFKPPTRLARLARTKGHASRGRMSGGLRRSLSMWAYFPLRYGPSEDRGPLRLPLCQFSPVAIAAMVGFLHRIHRARIPFIVVLFRLLFRAQVVTDGFTGLF